MPLDEPDDPLEDETVAPEVDEEPGLVLEDEPRLKPEEELPVGLEDPIGLPNPEDDPVEVPFTVEPGWPEDTMEEAAPRPPAPPPIPARGLPKKPFTVVFASPT